MTRSYVKKAFEEFPLQAENMSLVVTVNSPMGGMPSATSGVELSPIVVPAWRDPARTSASELHSHYFQEKALPVLVSSELVNACRRQSGRVIGTDRIVVVLRYGSSASAEFCTLASAGRRTEPAAPCRRRCISVSSVVDDERSTAAGTAAALSGSNYAHARTGLVVCGVNGAHVAGRVFYTERPELVVAWPQPLPDRCPTCHPDSFFGPQPPTARSSPPILLPTRCRIRRRRDDHTLPGSGLRFCVRHF